MCTSRRDFLRQVGGGAALSLAAAGGCASGDRAGVRYRAEGAPLPAEFSALPDEIAWRLANVAMQAAADAHVTFADVRVCLYRSQQLRSHDGIPAGAGESGSRGYGIRVLADGGWGFAAGPEMTVDGVRRTFRRALQVARASAAGSRKPWPFTPPPKYVDEFVTPHEIDAWSVPIGEKMDLLMRIQKPAAAVAGVTHTFASMGFDREEKFYASTVGSRIKQVIHRSDCGLTAAAFVKGAGFKHRTFGPPMRNAGYEDVKSPDWAAHSQRIGEEAVAYLKAPRGPDGVRKDLVLLPSHLHLTIHESVGHPTELDRALLWEADYAGTSFATPDKLNAFRYGSDLVNLTGDRTLPNGRSTVAYDDEGTKTMRFPLVRNGIFVGHSSDRISAALIGQESHGCAYADSWEAQPIVRQANTWLEADPKGPTLEQIISDTKDGILIDGLGAYSIDHQRKNFQFGGDMFWEIKNGKRGGPLRDVTYQAITWEFWRSCDAIGGPATWEPWGVNTCGKGQPNQTGQMTHGCPPARFRQVAVGAQV